MRIATPAGAEAIRQLAQEGLKGAELVVDGNAQGLEDAAHGGLGIVLRRLPWPGAQGVLNRPGQGGGGLDGLPLLRATRWPARKSARGSSAFSSKRRAIREASNEASNAEAGWPR